MAFSPLLPIYPLYLHCLFSIYYNIHLYSTYHSVSSPASRNIFLISSKPSFLVNILHPYTDSPLNLVSSPNIDCTQLDEESIIAYHYDCFLLFSIPIPTITMRVSLPTTMTVFYSFQR